MNEKEIMEKIEANNNRIFKVQSVSRKACSNLLFENIQLELQMKVNKRDNGL